MSLVSDRETFNSQRPEVRGVNVRSRLVDRKTGELRMMCVGKWKTRSTRSARSWGEMLIGEQRVESHWREMCVGETRAEKGRKT